MACLKAVPTIKFWPGERYQIARPRFSPDSRLSQLGPQARCTRAGFDSLAVHEECAQGRARGSGTWVEPVQPVHLLMYPTPMAVSQQDPSQARGTHHMIHTTVQPGETLSGIAEANGVSLQQLEAVNPQVSNPNMIYAGEKLAVPQGGSLTQWTQPSNSVSSPSQSSSQSAPSSSGGIDSIPGVPSSFVSCVAFRESTNGTNAAYNGGVYGIITASGYNVNGQSLAAQKAAFSKLYAQYGGTPWAADGCPGT